MGTFFVLKDKMYQTDVFKAVYKAGRNGHGDKFCYLRECAFIRMMVLCAQNVRFVNAAQLSQLTMIPENQCNLVWAVCVEKNVLRHRDGYYSAASWMSENGYLVSDNPANPRNEQQPKEEKIEVRNNVFLTRSELAELEKKYSQSDMDILFRELSEYKLKSNRKYTSDYDAINRWVYKRLEEIKGPQLVEGIPNPVPEFMRKR